MLRLFFILGAGCGLVGVALGAFGAHGLKDRLSPEMMAIFEIGVRYQMAHALALLAAAWASERWPGRLTTAAGWLFGAGILVFSGSLYILSLSGMRWFGAITPIGGVALLGGWLMLALAAWNSKEPHSLQR